MSPNETLEDDKLNVDDIIDALGDEEDKKDEEPPKEEEEEKPKVESKKEDEEEESKEEEEPLVEDEDDKYYDVPNRKAILKAYPELFKTFPGLEHALYREKQFTERFASPKDAEEAVEELKELRGFQEEVNNGSLETVLNAIKDNNKEAFGKITNNFLQTFAKVAPEAYYGTLNHVWSVAIYNMFMEGKNRGGEDGEQQQIAAQLVNKYIFGNPDIRQPGRINTEEKENPDKKKLDEERQEYNERRFNDATDDVTSRVDNKIRSAIELNIDRKEQMTLYVRNNAIKDALAQVEDEVEKDARFRTHLDKLWLESGKSNYSRETKEKIVNAILAKAKSILPDIIRKVKADALKGSSLKLKNEDEGEEKPVKRTTANDERRERKTSEREERKPNRRQSTLDYLNS